MTAGFKKAEFKKILPVLTIIVILTAALYFSKSNITGAVIFQIERSPVNLIIDTSQSYVISKENSTPFKLNSFRISGKVIGEGNAKIYLDNGAGIKKLIYSNSKGSIAASSQINEFTKNNIGNAQLKVLQYRQLEPEFEQSKDFVLGNFRNVCVETCSLDSLQFNSARYELSVYIEPGVTIQINEILYS